MKSRPVFAFALSMALTLSGCTTTKDLERRPELVAVESGRGGKGKAEEPGAAAARQSEGKATAGEAVAPSASSATSTSVPGAAAGVKPDVRTSTEQEAKTGSTASPDDGNQQKPQAAASSSTPQGPTAAPSVVIEKKIFIDRPIYYPESAQQVTPVPGETVANALSKGVMKPKDYNGAVIFYDYDDSLVYQVFTMPLRVTDLYLQPGEKVIEGPFCGDTTRWSIGGGVSKTSGVDTQHLYVKPSEEGLETTLIVNTDKRIYHLIIKSFRDTFMLAVMWRYPGFGLPYDFLSPDSKKQESVGQNGGQGASQVETAPSKDGIDPAFMSTDYTVSYPKNNPPDWLPSLVVDDGNKTYIILPETVMHHELPAVFGENGEIVNFRVKDNVFVIDRLMKKMQLKLRNVTVDIKKKGA